MLGARHRAWVLKPLLDRPPLPTRCLLATQAGEEDDGADATHQKSSRWEDKVVPALRTYRELNGNTLVAQHFVVPSDSLWPKVAWGYRLGNAVNSLRKRLQKGDLASTFVDELQKLNFVQDVSQYHWEEAFMPALRRYYKLEGHTDVPYRFVVPMGDKTWPELAWGWALGSSVNSIRCRDAYAEQIVASQEELRGMDFCFTDISERDWTEKVLPALRVYRQVFGHCIVDTSFVVPAEPPWPERSWGLRLGSTATMIRSGQNYAKQSTHDKAVLDSLGFAWNIRGSVWKERIAPTLKMFATQNRHCKIPWGFVVPSHDPWPNYAWGIAIGNVLYRVRKDGAYFSHFGRDADWLDTLGLNMRLSPEAFKKCVAPLLDTYETVTGDRYVPDDFVIRPEAPWPEKMWGVHLGVIIARNAHNLV